MKGHPYGDFHQELLKCIAHARSPSDKLLSISEDLSLEWESRFIEDFRIKFISEETGDFTESAKLDEAARYYAIFSSIFAHINTEILPKLISKNAAQFVKLETDSEEILSNISKFLILAVNKFTHEIEAESQSEKPISQSDLLRIFNVQRTFLAENAAHIKNAEIIEAIKSMYSALSTFHKFHAESHLVFSHLTFTEHRQLFVKGSFTEELRDTFGQKLFFDACFTGQSSTTGNGEAAARILFYHCDTILKVLLHNKDEDRIVHLAEAVATFAKRNNLQLQSHPAANAVLNAFVRQYGDSMEHTRVVDLVNEARFCYCNLDSDQTKQAASQGFSVNPAFSDDSLEEQAYKNAKGLPILTSDIVDESFANYSRSVVPNFKQFIAEKKVILDADLAFEEAVVARFPNFQRNAYVRSFVESLLATNAYRAQFFQTAFFQNLLTILSKTPWPDCLKEVEVKELLLQSLDLVHSCSTGFKVTLLHQLRIPSDKQILVSAGGKPLAILQVFLELFVDILEKFPNTLTFLTYNGLAKSVALAQRSYLNYGDHASVLVASYDAQTVMSLRLSKQLCTLYGLFKTQSRISEKNLPQQQRSPLSNLVFTDILNKARKILPNLVATHLPKKVEYYVTKMENFFETNFIRVQQNQASKKAAMTFLSSAFQVKDGRQNTTRTNATDSLHVNTFSISRTFLSDVDPFNQVKKGLEKYLITLPQQILKATKDDESLASLSLNLYVDVSTSLLSSVFTGRIGIEATIKEAFLDLAKNVVVEQEIRKSLTSSPMRSPFDQLDYYTKLASLSQGILAAFRKFKIGIETQKILREGDSAVTREAWYKYQFYVLAATFLRWWVYHFTYKQPVSNPLTMEEILSGMTEADVAPLNISGEVLKILILDTASLAKNTAAKEQCLTFLLNVLNIRHFYLVNAYDESHQLELSNHKLFEDAPPSARVFIGTYIARVLGEISRTGLALSELECKSIAQLIPFLQTHNDRTNIAFVMAFLQQMALDLFRENNPSFAAQKYAATDLFISMHINKQHETLPDGLRALIDNLRREVNTIPSVNKGALLGTLVYVIIEVINKQETWIMKYAKYHRQNHVEFFIQMLDVYNEHLTLAPQSIKQSVINTSNMMSLLNVWLNQIVIYIKESAKQSQIETSVLVNLFRKSSTAVSKLVGLLESTIFQDLCKYSKTFSPHSVLRNLLCLIAFCLGSLKYEAVTIDAQLDDLVKTLIQFTSIHYEDFLVDRVSGQKNTHQLWTPLMRCFELLFTFQKENFIKSNIEIRLKNALYVPTEKRFPPFFNLTELSGKRIVKRDMLEHGRSLRQVLSQLFEGIPEDSIIFEDAPVWEPENEILPELIKDEGDFDEVKKNEGDGEGGEAGEDQEKQENENQQQAEQPIDVPEDVPAEAPSDEQPIPAADDADQPAVDAEDGAEVENNAAEGDENQQQVDALEGEGAEGQQQVNENNNGEEGVLDGDAVEKNSQAAAEDDGVGIVLADENNNANDDDGAAESNEQHEKAESEKPDTRKIGFKVTVSNALSTSKVVKLSTSQKQLIDSFVDLLESRINDSYTQAKEKHEETAQFNIFYIEFPFIVRLLKMLMTKYPLVIPYLLDRKIRVPEFGVFKKSNVITFLDYLIVGGAISEFTASQMLEIILTVNYTYSERKKVLAEGEEENAEEEEGAGSPEPPADEQEGEQQQPPADGGEVDEEGKPLQSQQQQQQKKKKKAKVIPVIGSTEHYITASIERTLSWVKKVIETKNFMTLDHCHTVLFGLLNNLRYFTTKFASFVTTEQCKRVIAITTLLIKRAANQTDLFKLISLNVFELMAKCIASLPTHYLRDRKVVLPNNGDQNTTNEYLNYFVNRNILTYFEKEKAAELEKASVFNHLDIFTAINANLKLNVPEILQIRHTVASKGPLSNESALFMSSIVSDAVQDTSASLLATEKALEGLFYANHVIQSIDDLQYQHHSAFNFGLQQLYDYYSKHPGMFAKREHTASFIYSLSHLYVVLRRQTEFDSQDYSLLETIYHQRPKDQSQFAIIDQIIYNHLEQQQPSADEQPVVAQLPAGEQPNSQLKINSLHALTQVIRQVQEAVNAFSSQSTLLQSTKTNTSSSYTAAGSTTVETKYSHSSDFDFAGHGYPADAIQRYSVNASEFSAATHEKKAQLLQEHKQKYLKQQKLAFLVEREKLLLEKFMAKIKSYAGQGSSTLQREGAAEEAEEQLYQEQNNNGQPANDDENEEDHDERLLKQHSTLLSETKATISAADSLKIYLQQNIIDFFNELPPKEQNVHALLWEPEVLSVLPESLQLKVSAIRNEIAKRIELPSELLARSTTEQQLSEIESTAAASYRSSSKKIISAAEVESDISQSRLPEESLFKSFPHCASLERILKHKNLVLEMAPSFDDEFILKLFESLHIYTSKLHQQSHEHIVELLLAVSMNPYNAYRIVDLLSFLLFFYPRRGKVLNDPINQNNLAALVESPILIVDKQTTHKADVDNKYAKAVNYISIIQKLLARNQSHALYGLIDYPLIQTEEAQLSLGRHEDKLKNTTIPLGFRPLDQLKDVKLAGFIKGHKDLFTLHSLIGFAQKWILSEKNLTQSALVYQNDLSQQDHATAVYDSYLKTYYSRFSFNGTVKALVDVKYPQLVRPSKELNSEEFIEAFTGEIQADLTHNQRLSESSIYPLLVDRSKVFAAYLDVSKIYIKASVKKLLPELKRLQAAFLHKRNQVKLERDFLDLKDSRVAQSDIDSYNDFLVAFSSFLRDQMKTFKKSFKDLTVLFRVAEKEELKQSLGEYNKISESEGQEAASAWFQTQASAVHERLVLETRNALLVEDPNTLLFLIELLQFLIQSINFAWSYSSSVIPAYTSFNYPLKVILLLYGFLYPEEKIKRLGIVEPKAEIADEGIVADAEGTTEILAAVAVEGEQNSAALEAVTSEQPEVPAGPAPEVLKLLAMTTDNVADSVTAGISIMKTIIALNANQISKSFVGVNLTHLFELIVTEQIKLIKYLVNSNDVKSKTPFMEIALNLSQLDLTISHRLNSENIMDHAISVAKSMAKQQKQLSTVTEQAPTKVIINCKRDEVWQSSLNDLTRIGDQFISAKSFDIRFEGEQVNDKGKLGLWLSVINRSNLIQIVDRTAEWFQLMLKDVLDPLKGVFRSSPLNGVTKQPNPDSEYVPNSLFNFFTAGRIIAKGLLEKYDMGGVYFTKSFLKQILHQALFINDIEDSDPIATSELKKIEQAKDLNQHNEVYVISRQSHGLPHYPVQLITNGANVRVTEQNKNDFILKSINYVLREEVAQQTSIFVRGFNQVLPKQALQGLTDKDLGLLLAGAQNFDVEDMREHMSYQDYTKDSQIINWFFEVLSEFTDDQRSLFLYFFTGSFAAPKNGFKDLPFPMRIVCVDDTKILPVARVYKMTLELPNYEYKELLVEKLTQAIEQPHQEDDIPLPAQ